MWKINLTQNFVALSTLGYTSWEEFAQKLDKVLALFIQIYQPAFFERLGLCCFVNRWGWGPWRREVPG